MPLRINDTDLIERHVLLQREVREEVLAETEAAKTPLPTLAQTEVQMKKLADECREIRSHRLAYAELPIQIYIDHGDRVNNKPRQHMGVSIRSAWRSLRKLLRVA